MGVVYEAFDLDRGGRVAVKTLGKLRSEYLLRLKNEFRALQGISHPNILSAHELIENDGHWYVVMELIEGVDLMTHVRGEHVPQLSSDFTAPTVDLIRVARTVEIEAELVESVPSNASFDEERLRDSLAQLASALITLHRHGKVHRDVKPSNIWVTDGGRVVLLDFGLVFDVGGPETEDDRERLIGTAAYAAPEQVGTREIASPADWYAVGAILYHAMTGRPPFLGTADEMIHQKRQFAPIPPSAIREVPPDLEQLCLALLAIDPHARPTGEEVQQRLGGQAPATVRATAGLDNQLDLDLFVGRDREREALAVAFERAQAGQPSAVIVRGESGLGKSALVRQFCSEIRDRRPAPLILAGRCYAAEAVPYNAVDGLIDALSWHLKLSGSNALDGLPESSRLALVRIFPVLQLGRASSEDGDSDTDTGGWTALASDYVDALDHRTSAFRALRTLLAEIARERVVVLTIDDFHRADSDSLALLREVLQPPGPSALLFLATVRVADEGDETGAPPVDLPIHTSTIELERLSLADSRALAEELLRQRGAQSTAWAHAIAEEADGLPFFISELVAHSELGNGARENVVHLDQALGMRIDRLDREQQRILALLAVSRGPLTQRVTAHALDVEPAELTDPIASLRSGKLIRISGVKARDRLETYHDRIRETVLGRLELEEFRDCHRRLVAALEREDRLDPEALSTHWEGAGDRQRAARYALQAADVATDSLAFDRAARLYERALALGSPRSEPELLRKLGDALAHSGFGRKAAEIYLEAAQLVEGDGALDLRQQAADQFLRGACLTEGLAITRAVLREVGMSLPRSFAGAVSSLLWRRLRLRMRGLDRVEPTDDTTSVDKLRRVDICWSVALSLALIDQLIGADFQARALLNALQCGEPARISKCLAAEACYVAVKGSRQRARVEEIISEARRLAHEADDPFSHAWVTGLEGLCYHQFGEYAHSQELFSTCETILRNQCTGVAWEMASIRMFLLESMYYLGQLRDYESLHRELSSNANDRGDQWALSILKVGFSNSVWLFRDQAAVAREMAVSAHQAWPTRRFDLRDYYQYYALSQVDIYEGAHEDAMARIEECRRRSRRAFIDGIQTLRIEMAQTHGRAALGAAAKASGRALRRFLAAARRDARRLEREDSAWAGPQASLLRAGVALHSGQPDACIAELEDALAGFEDSDLGLFAAAVRYQLGGLRGGEEGRWLRLRARAWMIDQGIARPERVAEMMAPGFSARE